MRCGNTPLSITEGFFFAKSRVSPESIDLNSVLNFLIEKQGWTRERGLVAREEYRRFLTLHQKNPGFMLVPWPNAEGQDDVDQFWHQHILDTAKYGSDCKRLFGRMIHHNPQVVRGSGQETDAVEKTQRLYARTFGSGSFGRPVDEVFLTGCGACAAVVATAQLTATETEVMGTQGTAMVDTAAVVMAAATAVVATKVKIGSNEPCEPVRRATAVPTKASMRYALQGAVRVRGEAKRIGFAVRQGLLESVDDVERATAKADFLRE